MTKFDDQDTDGLIVDGISKSFGHNLVLDNLTLQVDRGKLVSLLGPSGCGKTTTLNMIAGFESPDSGSIRLSGADITSIPPNRRDTAIVFQNYALFPHMNVAKNIGYGLKVRKKKPQAISSAVGRIAELLGLGADLLDRYPGQLSGGQQQRVSLARAIAVEPSLLLLDEPLSNLDAKLRQEIRVEIRRLQQELSQTAVFVTHDQEEALAISDYIAILNKGRLEQFGTPDQLWEHPDTVYVADFMGVDNIIELFDGIEPAGPGAISRKTITDRFRNSSHIGFRPSQAKLEAGTVTSTDSFVSIPVTVRSKSYMGTHFRYECQILGTDFEIKIDQGGTDQQFDAGETGSVTVQSTVMLGLRNGVIATAGQDPVAAGVEE